MLSEHNGTDEQSKQNDMQIPSEFLNVFGFIDYKHDGCLPWTTTQNISLPKEYLSVTNLLGIDCEMVGVGDFNISALGRVSIVNEHGYCVYDTFVNPLVAITDYCTKYSGIRAEDLVGAPSVGLVLQNVASLVKGRILVGHSIHNDLEVLKLDHPIADIRDTANFFQHRNGNKRTPSLKNLVKEHFNATIQDGEHSSIQDAQATLRLYLLFKEDWEQDALERRRKANLDDTLTDISCMHILPRPRDIFIKSESVFIRPNKLDGAYYSSEEYKDIQFRLLMEDVLRPLRDDIRIYKQRRLLNNHFKGIRIAQGNSIEDANFEVKSYKTLLVPIPSNGLEAVDWDDRSIFLSGSLLILSPDNFNSVKFAKVIDIGNNQRQDSVILLLSVKFLLDGPSWKVSDQIRFQMIESKAFFLPYEYTLNFLQDVDLDTFPMKKYIVDGVTQSDVAPNLLNTSVKKIDFSILMDNINSQTNVCAHPLDFERWPNANQLNLDESQYEGLQKAITQELTIIQGPPGTGKSHVSLQIVKLLLTNSWLSSSPILIVSYTNHALDELLEPVLHFLTERIHGGNVKKAEQSLLRIGGGCESESVFPCTMKFKKEMLREKKANKKLVKSLEKALLKVNGLDFQNKLIHQGILNFKLVPQTMIAKLETDEQSKGILKLWLKAHKDIEKDVYVWFGLNKESVQVRPKSLRSINDGLFILLCNNLQPILSGKLSKIPTTLEQLNDLSLYSQNQDQRYVIRWGYYLFLVGRLATIVKSTINELTLAENASKQLQEYAKENAVIRQAKVIGMTTTGAVKYKKMVETQFKSKIMIVEEAAHVLEAYVVASLTKHCTQLILIGDHKQLRPMISNHDLAKDFLDVSLMERLVKNGIAQNTKNWTQLKVQHRMRPDIASLICPVIYDELENHSDVTKYPNVVGCTKNLFFVHHENPESLEARSKSRFNAYEAKYIIGLLTYFTDCGYLPTQVTVICTYLAQKTLIENTIRNDEKLNQFQISTVDGFQGKQNDVIILSLVRNNSDGNVGFLKTDNRVCVALSRARHGLFMIGNMEILKSSSETWSQINEILAAGNGIGTELPLTNPRLFNPHGALVYSTCRPSSVIRSRPERTRGRGRRSRGTTNTQSTRITSTTAIQTLHTTKQLACGHSVNIPCGADASRIKCNSKIIQKLSCGHQRHVLCCEKGKTMKCSSSVQKELECGHLMQVACHKQHTIVKCGHVARVPCHKLRTVTCVVPVSKLFPCGHQSSVPCHQQHCNKTITARLLCGHEVQGVCGDNNSQIKCTAAVKHKFSCGHQGTVPCQKTPVRNVKCNFETTKKLDCGHSAKVLCGLDSSKVKCVAKVKKTLSCGHEVQVFCKEKHSDIKCSAVIKRKYQCGHLHLFSCSKEVKNAKTCNSCVDRILPCGHVQRAACHQNPLSIKCRQLVTVNNMNFECNQIKEMRNTIDSIQKSLAKIQLNK